jgi:hypothetical protein
VSSAKFFRSSNRQGAPRHQHQHQTPKPSYYPTMQPTNQRRHGLSGTCAATCSDALQEISRRNSFGAPSPRVSDPNADPKGGAGRRVCSAHGIRPDGGNLSTE